MAKAFSFSTLDDDRFSREFEYAIVSPWRVGVGFAYAQGPAYVSVDVETIDWSELHFEDVNGDASTYLATSTPSFLRTSDAFITSASAVSLPTTALRCAPVSRSSKIRSSAAACSTSWSRKRLRSGSHDGLVRRQRRFGKDARRSTWATRTRSSMTRTFPTSMLPPIRSSRKMCSGAAF